MVTQSYLVEHITVFSHCDRYDRCPGGASNMGNEFAMGQATSWRCSTWMVSGRDDLSFNPIHRHRTSLACLIARCWYSDVFLFLKRGHSQALPG